MQQNKEPKKEYGEFLGEFLLELYSEEIPSKMQIPAGKNLQESISKKLASQGVALDNLIIKFFVSARRLTLYIENLPLMTEDSIIEKRGPKVGSKEEALNGFLSSLNVKKEDLVIKEIAGHQYYVLEEKKPAQEIKSLLPEIVKKTIEEFSWPKSMRWGNCNLRWVRPLRNILCIFNGQILPFEIEGLVSNKNTFGHFFIERGMISVNNFFEYDSLLTRLHVAYDHNKRTDLIKTQLLAIGKEHNISWIEDNDLLEEVSGLVEWPNLILAEIQQDFRVLPDEVLISSIKTNQKYFCFKEKNGKLSNYFVICSNSLTTNDEVVRSGNLRVLKARLSDALYFFEVDKGIDFSKMRESLDSIVFHNKLGSVKDKTKRIEQIAIRIGQALKLDSTNMETIADAAKNCKNDLVSQMVAEFPDLQGVMGGYYALASNFDRKTALAIKEHYLPYGKDSASPTSINACIISLADKIDSLYGLFFAGEKPTGSKDQFSLRRSMIGIIRILLEHNLPLSIIDLISFAKDSHKTPTDLSNELLDFYNDRLLSLMKENGYDHDLSIAVITSSHSPVICHERVRELTKARLSDSFNTNINALARALSFKTSKEQSTSLDLGDYTTTEEINLVKQLKKIKNNSFVDLTNLAPAINDFFDKTMINDPEKVIRERRLNLVKSLQEKLLDYADFSKISS
jgi:glycyl-tRNA synthetase beta chain